MRIPLIPILALAGCGAPVPEAANDSQPPPANVTSANTTAANDPPRPPESSTLSDAIIVSTNEPFWQVRIEAGFVTLIGAGLPERRLRIVSSKAGPDSRHVMARDGNGQLEATVRDTPCQDSMSGAHFPFSGSIAIEGGGGADGCARPAGTPPPPVPRETPDGEAETATIPARFVGRWAPDGAACRNPASSIEGLTIEPRAMRYHESLGVPSRIKREGARRISVTSRYDGEGQQWTATQTLRLSAGGDRLTVVTNGESFERIRCP